ncbi:FHA domain-containing protein [Leptolyngbya sp. 7M]|uniref:FHA domain-containing protein n=1 Tax=Leptolyngbya sp. 7M TaxID=2812896 RepID=UPI001B8D3F79|nr:FHA domain-containing protein [Leptolyngbya sp. 7M]QYO66366.1 FHA domain-containing protein [Leptolyngbya sp. 7M]
MLDAEIREDASGRKFAPHNIQLKMQWDKFSTDADNAIKALENEMLIAVIDHINDRHYYSYAPIRISVKTDYFTEGVKLLVSFEELTGNEEEREIHVSVPDDNSESKIETERVNDSKPSAPLYRKIRVRYSIEGKAFERIIQLIANKRISIGRTKENDIAINDRSISKYHAAIVLNSNGRIVVADTGSTNGTFIEGKKLEYGKAVELVSGQTITFGVVTITIDIEQLTEHPDSKASHTMSRETTEALRAGDLFFASKRIEWLSPEGQSPSFSNPQELQSENALQPSQLITASDEKEGEKDKLQ